MGVRAGPHVQTPLSRNWTFKEVEMVGLPQESSG